MPPRDRSSGGIQVIEVDGDFKKVSIDPRVSDRAVCIRTETGQEEQAEIGQPPTLCELVEILLTTGCM
jgi:hypothetical protein